MREVRKELNEGMQDAVGEGVHGGWVSTDEESSKVHSGQVVQSGVQAGQLPNIITDHVQQALGDVFFGEL